MSEAIDDSELLTEVPPILKRLAKTVAYAFYEGECIVTLSILTKYPCLDEDSLLERLQFDKRQMRQVLGRLKCDKLIKQRVIKEKQVDSANFNIYNFYFINYKVFVNVVKYKLDHIRKKLEHEEQQARNRPSFQCQTCHKNFSDLEVDRLLDFETGMFKCTFCHGPVDEDLTHVINYSNGSSLGKFNEQMETIYKLLKECENINLAPEVLEPTPSTDEIKSSNANKSHGSSSKSGWANRKTFDLYDQTFQVNVGDEIEAKVAKAPKVLPVWMSQSTVLNEESNDSLSNVEGVTTALPTPSTSKDQPEEHEIMSDLLAYESAPKKAKFDSPTIEKPEVNVILENEHITETIPQVAEPAAMVTEEMMDSDEDDEEETQVKVGDKSYALEDINDEIITKMTPTEHETYLKLYNEAFQQFY